VARRRDRAVEAMWKRPIVHAASLVPFPIFCNKLCALVRWRLLSRFRCGSNVLAGPDPPDARLQVAWSRWRGVWAGSAKDRATSSGRLRRPCGPWRARFRECRWRTGSAVFSALARPTQSAAKYGGFGINRLRLTVAQRRSKLGLRPRSTRLFQGYWLSTAEARYSD
jgi:hypothetical protein